MMHIGKGINDDDDDDNDRKESRNPCLVVSLFFLFVDIMVYGLLGKDEIRNESALHN